MDVDSLAMEPTSGRGGRVQGVMRRQIPASGIRIGSWSRLVAGLLGVMLVGVNLGWIGVANAESRLACGDTVSTDVRLTASLHCAAGPALVVIGNVTVDFDGHAVTGLGSGVGIRAGGATLLNGTIKGFDTGVSGFATLKKMTVTRNGDGVLTDFPGFFRGLILIDDTSIVANAGIGVQGERVEIHDSSILRNGGVGIWSHQGLLMSKSTVAWNGAQGVDVRSPAVQLLDSGVSLVGNVFRNNDIVVSTPYNDQVYLEKNRFMDSQLTVFGEFVTLVDGGGNRGNSCPSWISC
jgi:hypothetical protein